MTPSKNNRRAILDAALALFNAHGTGSVTTNHIARAAKISPGNLYYHFRNKTEIIRELYEMLFAEYGAMWGGLKRGPLGLLQIVDVISDGFEVNWKYRFLCLELVTLCQNDPELKRRQRENYLQRFSEIREVAAQAFDNGILESERGEDLVEDLTHIEWLINEYWLSYVRLQRDEPMSELMQLGARLALRVLEPYLKSEYRELLNHHFESRNK